MCLSVIVISDYVIAAEQIKSSDGRYIDNGDGSIIDKNTGLMWTKKDSYADLGRCLDWNASKDYVSNLKIGGHSDWRLPTVDELKGIYEQSKSNTVSNTIINGKYIAHLDKIFASGGAIWYWSSKEEDKCCAWGVLFYGGTAGYPPKNNCSGRGVRAVAVWH